MISSAVMTGMKIRRHLWRLASAKMMAVEDGAAAPEEEEAELEAEFAGEGACATVELSDKSVRPTRSEEELDPRLILLKSARISAAD
jgi:hypothetical protein